MQRIGSGSLKGRRLLPLPRGIAGLRPTASRVREAIFDRLADEVVDTRVLDLFAGSGGLSIEALSRGARSATLLDASTAVVAHLRAQLQALALGDRSEVHCADALRWVGRPAHAIYDLVLVDPPFASAHVFAPAIAALVAHGWLAPGALVVCEREKIRGHAASVEYDAGVELEAVRDYGQVTIEYLRRG